MLYISCSFKCTC